MPGQCSRRVYEFGSWEIDLKRRELMSHGRAITIGSRAFEILEVLVESAGDVVSKAALMGRIWPGAIVEENALQAQISAVRRALGRDRTLLKTESGRGYRLLGGWSIQGRSVPAPPPVETSANDRFRTNLPKVISELIGREDAVHQVLDLVSAYRIVTLTGAGGIGKTVMAQTVAHRLLSQFEGNAWLIEFSSLADASLVPSAIAGLLGLKLGVAEISAVTVARAIAERKLLLVLDNCEHVIGAVAEQTEAIASICPNVSILATSREVLRVAGEYVYRVMPLEVPLLQEGPSDTLEYSAVQLFVARTTAASREFSPTSDALHLIAAICRRLDGIPLALELAAARAAAIGVPQVASRLDDRFALLSGGRRMALPRHQTLRATLAWSYDLLTQPEQRLLRRLAVFPGGFTLDAATAVMDIVGSSPAEVLDGVANLVTKSLITPDGIAPSGRWRLLETTRAYALERLAEAGEIDNAARCHAEFFRDLVTPAAYGSRSRPVLDDFELLVEEIDNVRAALDWAFSEAGDSLVGIVLTAAYASVWTRLSSIAECRRRVERALNELEKKSDLNPHLKMLLTIALATAFYHCTGTAESTGTVLNKALELAENLDDDDAKLRTLWVVWSYNYNRGNLKEAQPIAERYGSVARRVGDSADGLIADRIMGTTMHQVGNQTKAQFHLERVRTGYVAPKDQRHIIWHHYNQSVLARSILARVLWLQGYADQAKEVAQACFEDAQSADDKLSLCYTLCFAAGPIALMRGDLKDAGQAVAMLSDIVTMHGQVLWQNLTDCREAQLLIKNREFAAGCIALREALDACDAVGGTTCYPEFHGALAEGLSGLGKLAEARATIEQAITHTERMGELWCLPELVRIKGELSLRDSISDAEDCFKQSIELANEQGAMSWYLRSAISLANLRIDQDRHDDARQVLTPIYDQFTEGFATADLRAAKAILGSLSS